MRRLSVILLFILGALPSAYGKNPYPLRLKISQETAIVRSGPSDEHYETSTLRSGEIIEVYHEAEDGWLAIRPPLGSFSWVGGEYVQLGVNSVGTIAADGLASRIGSQFVDECNSVQVRFKEGDRVLVLDRLETPENEQCKFWLKIAPPRGEFRWIHRCAVSDDGHECHQSHANLQKPVVDSPIEQVAFNEEIQKEEPQPKIVAALQKKPKIDPFVAGFLDLQTATFHTMNESAEDWEFEILIAKGKELYTQAQSERERTYIFRLVDALEKTRQTRREIEMARVQDAIKKGRPISQEQPVSLKNTASPLAPLQEIAAIRAEFAEKTEKAEMQGFHAVGRLGRFNPPIPGVPLYAIADEKEQIICYVTPTDATSIAPYVGKTVGLNGQPGLFEKDGLSTPHLLTDRIQVLSGQ